MHALILLLLAAPKPFTSTRDGQEFKVVADTAEVATSPLLGKRFGFSLAGDTPNAFPRIDVTAAWSKFEGQREAKVSVVKSKLGADLQVYFRGGQQDPNLPAEKASLALTLSENKVTAVLEVSFFKGPTVSCKLDDLPLVIKK